MGIAGVLVDYLWIPISDLHNVFGIPTPGYFGFFKLTIKLLYSVSHLLVQLGVLPSSAIYVDSLMLSNDARQVTGKGNYSDSFLSAIPSLS